MKARFKIKLNEDGSLALPIPFERPEDEPGLQIVYADVEGNRTGGYTLENVLEDGMASVWVDTSEDTMAALKADGNCEWVEDIADEPAFTPA